MSETVQKTIDPIQPDAEGRLHTFKYEADTFIPLLDWIQANKTAEEYASWMANDQVGTHTDAGAEYYIEWLLAQKMVHIINRPDGIVVTNDYKDYL
jgi:hypothetical protein